MKPCFELVIAGTEHDAVVLADYATLVGRQLKIAAALLQEKSHWIF